MIVMALVALAMPAPSPPHAPAWPPMERQFFRFPDGRDASALFWREGMNTWRFRDVDQDPHPVHLDSPLDVWERGGLCNPDLCKPLPPGSIPGDRRGYRELPKFLGPPE